MDTDPPRACSRISRTSSPEIRCTPALHGRSGRTISGYTITTGNQHGRTLHRTHRHRHRGQFQDRRAHRAPVTPRAPTSSSPPAAKPHSTSSESPSVPNRTLTVATGVSAMVETTVRRFGAMNLLVCDAVFGVNKAVCADYRGGLATRHSHRREELHLVRSRRAAAPHEHPRQRDTHRVGIGARRRSASERLQRRQGCGRQLHPRSGLRPRRVRDPRQRRRPRATSATTPHRSGSPRSTVSTRVAR